MAVSREQRIARARELSTQNPTWGARRINQELRQELGTGLRTTDVSDIVQQVHYATPRPRGTKTVERIVEERLVPEMPPERYVEIGFEAAYHRMLSAGFMPNEIRQLFSAHGVVQMFNSRPFKAMLRSRRNWVRGLRKQGWSKQRIAEEIKRYYQRDTKRSPFDFLRLEYKPPLKVDYKEYRQAARRRAQRQTKALYSKKGARK